MNAACMNETHGTYSDYEYFDIHAYDDETDHDTDDTAMILMMIRMTILLMILLLMTILLKYKN